MNNRNLYAELSEALAEAKAHSEGKLTLKSYQFEDAEELVITPSEMDHFSKQR